MVKGKTEKLPSAGYWCPRCRGRPRRGVARQPRGRSRTASANLEAEKRAWERGGAEWQGGGTGRAGAGQTGGRGIAGQGRLGRGWGRDSGGEVWAREEAAVGVQRERRLRRAPPARRGTGARRRALGGRASEFSRAASGRRSSNPISFLWAWAGSGPAAPACAPGFPAPCGSGMGGARDVGWVAAGLVLGAGACYCIYRLTRGPRRGGRRLRPSRSAGEAMGQVDRFGAPGPPRAGLGRRCPKHSRLPVVAVKLGLSGRTWGRAWREAGGRRVRKPRLPWVGPEPLPCPRFFV